MQLLVPLHFACLELSLIVEFDYFILLSGLWGGEKNTSQPEKRLIDTQKSFVDTLFNYTERKGDACSCIILICL